MRTLPGHLFFFVFLIFYIFSIQYFGPSQDFDSSIVAFIGLLLCGFIFLKSFTVFKNSFFYSLSSLLILTLAFFHDDFFHVLNVALLWWVSMTLSKVVSFDKKIFNFWPYFCLAISIVGLIYFKINNYPIYTFPFNWHNQSAILLGTSIPFWLLKIFNQKEKNKLLKNCFCLFFICYCVFLTGSKAGIAVCLLFFIVSASLFNGLNDNNVISRFFSFFQKIKIFLVFVFIFLVPKIYNNIVNDFSFQSRIAYFKGALEMGKDSFLTGVGWGNFKFHYPAFQSSIEYSANDPHSWLFRAWAEGGLFGVILLFVFIFSIFKIFKRIKKNDEKCFFIAAVMILIHGLVDFHATFIPLPLLVGCFLGFSSRRSLKQSNKNNNFLNIWPVCLGFFALFFVVMSIFSLKGCGDQLQKLQCTSNHLKVGFGVLSSSKHVEKVFESPESLKYSHVRQIVENRDRFPKNTNIRQSLLALENPQKDFINQEERLSIAKELLLIDSLNRPEFALIFATESWGAFGPNEILKKEILDSINLFLNEWPRFNDREEIFSFKLDARARKLDVVFANLWEIKSILETEKSQKDLALMESQKFSD